MRRKSSHAYLRDILDYLAKANAFTSKGREAFLADEMAQFAVIRVYEVVGEVVKRLPSGLRDANPQIDWRKLASFRDFLSHNYDEVVQALVWQAIEDLPELRDKVQTLLDSLPPEHSD